MGVYREQMQHLFQQARSFGVEFDEQNNIVANPNNVDLSMLKMQPPKFRPWQRHDAQYSDINLLQFGLRDLVLTGNLTECTSELEFSYGIGLSVEEAKVFLAGRHKFEVEAMEVWLVHGAGNSY